MRRFDSYPSRRARRGSSSTSSTSASCRIQAWPGSIIPTNGWILYPVTNVPVGGRAPTSSTASGDSPISSSASRRAVSRRSSSGWSWRPPGNEISPAWWLRSARRSVKTPTRPPSRRYRGTSTAASVEPGASRAAACSGLSSNSRSWVVVATRPLSTPTSRGCAPAGLPPGRPAGRHEPRLAAYLFFAMEASQASRGRPLSRRRLRSRRSLESYLAAAVLPRYMERLREIHDELTIHAAHLQRAYQGLAGECGEEREVFERRWRAVAAEWGFSYVNELVEQHNEYYPIEANLAIDPRTGDYVKRAGRSYRRGPPRPAGVGQRRPALPPASPTRAPPSP